MSDQRQTIQQLTAQLDALVGAKHAHEEEMLTKFAALLNSKKMKIRDQQRLLAQSKVDPKIAARVQQTRADPRKPDTSRETKRKANGSPSDSATDEDEAVTGGETASGTEGEEFEPVPMASQPSRKGDGEPTAGARLASQANTVPTTRSRIPPGSDMEGTVSQMPPPRRELPFAKKYGEGKKPSPVPLASPAKTLPLSAEDETDSSDDEL